MAYRHVQKTRWSWLLCLAGIVGAAWAIVAVPGAGVIVAVSGFALLIAVGIMMSRLTVEVDGGVTAEFGWGWPRRSVAVGDIVGARRCHNSWWHGWGIRKVSRGWMFNVAGREAVELELVSGRVFRIGTDEPDALLAAIENRPQPKPNA